MSDVDDTESPQDPLLVHETRVDERNGYPVMRGERYAQSPLTGNWYRLTRWEDRGDGKFVAIAKQQCDETAVPGRPEP